jgi:hypothetical protein
MQASTWWRLVVARQYHVLYGVLIKPLPEECDRANGIRSLQRMPHWHIHQLNHRAADMRLCRPWVLQQNFKFV